MDANPVHHSVPVVGKWSIDAIVRTFTKLKDCKLVGVCEDDVLIRHANTIQCTPSCVFDQPLYDDARQSAITDWYK